LGKKLGRPARRGNGRNFGTKRNLGHTGWGYGKEEIYWARVKCQGSKKRKKKKKSTNGKKRAAYIERFEKGNHTMRPNNDEIMEVIWDEWLGSIHSGGNWIRDEKESTCSAVRCERNSGNGRR